MADEPDTPKDPQGQDPDRIVSDATVVMLLSVMEALTATQPETGALLIAKLKSIRGTEFAETRPRSMELVEIFIKTLEEIHGNR